LREFAIEVTRPVIVPSLLDLERGGRPSKNLRKNKAHDIATNEIAH
jgi:hypothetical protein